LVAATFSEQSLIAAEKELLRTYRQIEDTTPENAWGDVGEQCRRCDYRPICSAYRIT
jgi:radical SAM protein with 4Fe4S-binding SPASM domain